MDSGSAAHPSATDVVISSTDAATTTTAVSTRGVDPSILSNAAATLNLGLGTSDKKQSSTNRLSGANKIEGVHGSLDDAQCGVDILVSVLGFLKVTTTEENKSTKKLISEAA